jgi:transposase
MVVADGQGIPLGMSLHSASPQEVKLAAETFKTIRVGRSGRRWPDRVIADKGYDSDPFRFWLKRRGVELIAPHRQNRKRPKTQDGRALRRYRKRWKVERSFAWLGNYRRVVVRWDRRIEIYRAFVHIACLLITCNYL